MMKNAIINYLINNLNKSNQRAEDIYNKLSKHDDILKEFYEWVISGQFKNFVVVEGYTAQRLFNETRLEPLGAYNYLIYLRENPQEAKEMLSKGLPKL